jgi:lysozyme
MAELGYSAAGLELTRSFEGLRLAAYQDVVGIWTIGYGHTGADVHEGQVITEFVAEALLRADVAPCVACVNRAVTAPIAQHQFDALVDFAFNAGRGNLRRSTLLQKVNLGDFAGAAVQFGLWVNADGVKQPGLVRRRAAEAAMFRGEVAAWSSAP